MFIITLVGGGGWANRGVVKKVFVACKGVKKVVSDQEGGIIKVLPFNVE